VTPEAIINAYTDSLDDQLSYGLTEQYHLPDTIGCHVLASKFCHGGEAVDATLPLSVALAEPWPCDVHISMYVSERQVRVTKAEAAGYELTFSFAAYDLDFDGHRSRPTRGDFADLIRTLHLIDIRPNLVYSTRGGARLAYFIEPVHDPEWFEEHYASLMRRVSEPLRTAGCGYQMDEACRDWTRLFRSARITRPGDHGEVEEFGHDIRIFHAQPLDLANFHVRRKPPRPKPAGNRPFLANDPKLLRLIRTKLVPGNRNNALFEGLCHVYRRYNDAGAAKWIDNLREAAIAAGLDEAEFEQVNKSALKQKR
jgi:hypothetical protein